MAVAKKSVELFYDVVSPYSWIGFEVLTRYATKWNIDLKLKPFFLGGVMQASGNKAPATVANKATYLLKDIVRLRDHFHIPMNYPSDPFEVMFNKGSLQAMRYLTAVDMIHPDKTEAVTRALWMRIWSKDEDIVKPESLVAAGIDGGLNESVAKDIAHKIKDQAVKDRLKAYTEEALKLNAFGAPTIIAEDANGEKEMIFGSDRFHILADILGEKYEGPLVELAKSKL